VTGQAGRAPPQGAAFLEPPDPARAPPAPGSAPAPRVVRAPGVVRVAGSVAVPGSVRGAGIVRAAGAGGVAGSGSWLERGAAVVELLVVFLTLLVPLVYVMVVMADVQRALLATSSAAREAGRVYVTGSDRAAAERRAELAYREVLASYGIRAGDPRARMRLRSGCPSGAGSGCAGGFGPGAEVTVEVTYRVPVARVPFLGAVAGPAVIIGATHHTRVDRFRGLGG